MTPTQQKQFNRMRDALLRITKGYMPPDELRRKAEREYGCGFDEAIEMAYENMQAEAREAVKGVRAA